MENKFFIIDFDSTFIKTEGLEELAALALKNNPNREQLIKDIQQITNLGMAGKIDFTESLERRLSLLNITKSHLDQIPKILKKRITTSIFHNKSFFKKYSDQIYLISGGFEEFITPIAEDFGIKKSHILANKFMFDRKGNIIGFDKSRSPSKSGGKAEAVKKLKLVGDVFVIGDGYTDLQIKKSGAAKQFIAFTENVFREDVVSEADLVVKSFDEFLYQNKLPMSISYPKSKIKVLLLENVEQKAVEKFKEEGYQVELIKSALTEAELAEKIKDISILGIRSKTIVSKNVLKNANRLIAVGAFCIGTDQMDLEELSKKGVVVFNAPFQNTRSVVELAIGEMILLMRGIVEKNNKMHAGVWDKSAKLSNEIRGKTLGIIGYGNIGSQLSVLAEGLGMNVIFYDIVEKLALGNAVKAGSLEEVLKKSDVVTIHVSGERKNTNLISEKEFALMKDGVVFLNLSRGIVVDIKALIKYTQNNKIRAAGVDVYPREPKGKDDPFESELQGLSNVLLTPHIAGSTEEAQRNIAEFVSGKVIDYINTGNTYLSVNLPNIQLPQQGKAHRLLHLHKNVPGILAQINSVFAENGINILGQYLKTNDSLGFLITDVDKKYDSKVLKKLQKIDDTIEFRVLY